MCLCFLFFTFHCISLVHLPEVKCIFHLYGFNNKKFVYFKWLKANCVPFAFQHKYYSCVTKAVAVLLWNPSAFFKRYFLRERLSTWLHDTGKSFCRTWVHNLERRRQHRNSFCHLLCVGYAWNPLSTASDSARLEFVKLPTLKSRRTMLNVSFLLKIVDGRHICFGLLPNEISFNLF